MSITFGSLLHGFDFGSFLSLHHARTKYRPRAYCHWGRWKHELQAIARANNQKKWNHEGTL